MKRTRDLRGEVRTTAVGLGLLLLPALLGAQAGGGGAAGAGSGSGASGPGAGAAASGQAANGQAAGGQPGGKGAGQQSAVSSEAAAYASASPIGPDPRKPPTAKPGALTLAQAIDLAKTKNPTLLAAEQNLRAVKAQEIQAAVRANPYFTLYGTDVTNGAGSSTPYAYSGQVSRLFERGGKRGFRIEDAKATTAQTRAQLEDTERQTLLTVKTAFTHMLIAKDALQLSDATLQDFRHEVKIANDRYMAGDMAKLDFERLDLQLGNFESDHSNDVINLRQSSDQLQTLLGIESPTTEFDITGDIVPPVVAQTLDQLQQTALDKRPDYAAAKFGVAAAEANARLAVANGLTDPTLEGEYDRSGTLNSAGFSINIPLRIFDRNQGNKATARYQADASRFTVVAAKNQVASDVDQAYVGYAEAKRLSDRFSERYLDESRDVLGIAQFAFEHGGLALIDYLDALRDARSSTSDALNAYQQTWLAIHQLSAATATELVP